MKSTKNNVYRRYINKNNVSIMGEIVKNFNEFHQLNEGKNKIKKNEKTITLDKLLSIAKEAGETVLDAKDALEELSGYDDKVPVSRVISILKNYDLLNVIESHNLIDEGKKAKVSKFLMKAIDKYHEAQLEFQKLQKEFLSIPKEDIKARELMKSKLVAASKNAKAAEAEFQATLGKEDVDDIEIIW